MIKNIIGLTILTAMSFPLACYADAMDTTVGNMNSVGQQAVDTATTTQVKTALAAEPGISSLNIHVTTMNNVVYLEGMVMNQEQMDKVVEIVKNVNGVTSVDSSKLKLKQ